MHNKYLVLLSAVLLHLAVGSVYAWSILTVPIMDATGFSFSETATVFGVTIAVLGLTAALLGKRIRNWGPTRSCIIATILFLIGMILASVATHNDNLIALYLTYGVLVGAGTGIAYLVPIPILMTYFPKRKGMITGLIVMGFGLSSFMASFAYRYLIDTIGVDFTLAVAGIVFSILMLPSIFFLKLNPVCNETTGVETETCVKDIIKSKNFCALWIIFCVNIFVGVAIISILAPMTMDLFEEVNVSDATWLVAVAAIVNGVARIFWSTISDHLGRPLTFVMMILFEISALVSLFYWQDYTIYTYCILIIISCYGGMFACMPGYLADLFGTEKLADILGCMLTAWAIAGFFGPKTLTLIYELTGSYHHFFYIAALLMGLNTILSFFVSERTVLKI